MCLSLRSLEIDPSARIQVQILYLEVTLRQEFNCKLFLGEVIPENASRALWK